SFWVQVDRRTDDSIFRQIVCGLSDVESVRFVPRHRCAWGGFGHVAATLEGIDAIERSGADADYVILATGQDYPIKSNDRINAFLDEHAGVAFLDHFPLPHADWQNGGLDRIRAWHFRIIRRHVRIPPIAAIPIKRRFPHGFAPFGGSSYWCLPRECVRYIHQMTQKNPAFVRFFKTVDVPDEIFFQTVLLNSPYREIIVNDNLRHIDWKDLTAGSPSLLTKADFPALAASPRLFARKFDTRVDAEILDMIDQRLLGLT
ncbi:MAG TPA: beta-1,6-N-acetylglucosaminyltransferase, partial [Nitrolancea sp.]|nr:beta-1,6-N-acetylglucosaminyltransferase [Nitrolancea sp.]